MTENRFQPAGTYPPSTKHICYDPKHTCDKCEHYITSLDLCTCSWVENCDHYYGRRGGRKGCMFRPKQRRVDEPW